ncbi:MAG: hypothetical protein ACLUD0_05815 [Eubacterium ramulus]
MREKESSILGSINGLNINIGELLNLINACAHSGNFLCRSQIGGWI